MPRTTDNTQRVTSRINILRNVDLAKLITRARALRTNRRLPTRICCPQPIMLVRITLCALHSDVSFTSRLKRRRYHVPYAEKSHDDGRSHC